MSKGYCVSHSWSSKEGNPRFDSMGLAPFSGFCFFLTSNHVLDAFPKSLLCNVWIARCVERLALLSATIRSYASLLKCYNDMIVLVVRPHARAHSLTTVAMVLPTYGTGSLAMGLTRVVDFRGSDASGEISKRGLRQLSQLLLPEMLRRVACLVVNMDITPLDIR